MAAGSQGSRALSALPRHGYFGRTWRRDRGGGLLEQRRFVQARRYLVFYDATTAWFETDDEDVASYTWKGLKFEPLLKRGHSKEGRDNDPQVIIALAVTREGIPVRSWVFPGNTSDVTTVAKIKDDLRGMKLGRTLFVGDAGMYSAANLKELSKSAGRYILAAPVGKIKEIKDEVLSHPGRYADIAPNLRAKEVIIGDGERRRRYILCLNEDEADRQKWRRAEILKTLEATLKTMKKDHPKAACHLVASKRYGRYLSLDDKGRPHLDRGKIKKSRASRRQVRAHHQRRHVVCRRYRAWLQRHVDHRELLSQDENHGARSPPDVPLDASTHHRARQALRFVSHDPASGGACHRASLEPAHNHPGAAQGRQISKR